MGRMSLWVADAIEDTPESRQLLGVLKRVHETTGIELFRATQRKTSARHVEYAERRKEPDMTYYYPSLRWEPVHLATRGEHVQAEYKNWHRTWSVYVRATDFPEPRVFLFLDDPYKYSVRFDLMAPSFWTGPLVHRIAEPTEDNLLAAIIAARVTGATL